MKKIYVMNTQKCDGVPLFVLLLFFSSFVVIAWVYRSAFLFFFFFFLKKCCCCLFTCLFPSVVVAVVSLKYTQHKA